MAEIENVLDTVWPQLSASAQAEIDRNGVSYVDQEGDLVTSIVNGKDCVFTCYHDFPLNSGRVVKNCCLCALEKAFREGKTKWPKPISCFLYPVREKKLGAMVGLNYHRWDVCQEAVKLGTRLKMPVYKFLRDPLVRRFGEEFRDLQMLGADLRAGAAVEACIRWGGASGQIEIDMLHLPVFLWVPGVLII